MSNRINTSGLLDYQPAAVEQILDALGVWQGAADTSDMGVGKTAHAVAVIRELKEPTLVVCPSIAIESWRRMGAHLGTSFSILNYEMLRTGKTPFGQWEKPKTSKLPKWLKCETCQLKFKLDDAHKMPKCPHHYLGIHCVKVESGKHDYGHFQWHPNIKRIVFDEVHRCSAMGGTLQSDMLLGCKRQKIPVLGLSATLAESPLDLRAFGYCLGLHNYTDFYSWAAKRGCRRTSWGGMQFLVGEEKRKKIMADLHAELFPSRGARVRIADLGDKFPEVQIKAELYDLKEAGIVDRLHAEMDDAIQTLNGLRSGDEERAITSILRNRQEIELLTIPIYEELVHDANRSGFHCAIFLNFRRSVDELCKRLKTECRIDGSQVGAAGLARRMACIAAFQADTEPNIVSTSSAGNASIDLHDTHGNFPRAGLVAPGYDARQFRQIFGRLRRALARSKALYRVVLVAGTVQEQIHRALVGKLDCIDTLNDGDLAAANLPLSRGNLSQLFAVDNE